MSILGTIFEQIAKGLPLFIETEETTCEKTTYGDRPEFQPHIGQNYESNSERTLVISEIFSTKISPKDRKKDESYCEYVLKNVNNPSCVNIQQALQRHDENLTAENIAFCFFIHKEKVKVGSYRSDFSPRDLDNAINTLIPLINLLKPRKIVFLGSQTKRTVERRSGSKALNGKTFEQFLADFSIETEVILLRGRAHNEATIKLNKPKRFHFASDWSKLKKETDEEKTKTIDLRAFVEKGKKLLEASENVRQVFIERWVDSRIFIEKKLEKDEYIGDFWKVAKLFTRLTDFIITARHNNKEESLDGVIKVFRYEDFLQELGDRDGYDYAFEIEDCNEKCLSALRHYYSDLLIGDKTYENDIRDAFDFVSKKLNVAIIALDCFQEDSELSDDMHDVDWAMKCEYMCRFLDGKAKALQRLLIPIKAIIESFDDNTNNSSSYMSRKIEFVKDLVKELRPKDDDDPGHVMSLQMVTKRLNESNPPITTALGKKYDSKGKGVIVLLRNVYKTLVESSSEENQNIASEMLHCFTKRPVDKLLERTEENVAEGEYWKPFKNMDAKES